MKFAPVKPYYRYWYRKFAIVPHECRKCMKRFWLEYGYRLVVPGFANDNYYWHCDEHEVYNGKDYIYG